MQKNFIKALMVFIILFSFNIIIIAKEDKNGENKRGDSDKKTQREKKEIQQNNKSDSIQDKRDENEKFKDYIFKENVDINRRKIIGRIDDTEKIKNKLKIFQRNINQSDNDFNSIQMQYLEIIKEIEKINNEDMFLSLNLDNYQKNQIKEQIEVIEKSKSKINDLIIKIRKEFEISEKNKKSISIQSIELEKEFNKLNKQYRAIEWILYEQ